MKKIIPVVMLILFCARVNAQYFGSQHQSDELTFREQPLVISPVFKTPVSVMRSSFRIPGERQIKFGRTMTILGGAMFIGGIAMYSSADKTPTQRSYYNSNGQLVVYDEYDPKLTLGVLMMVGGTGLTVPGVIIWRKGIKKYAKYMKEQEGLSLGINGTSGILIYKF